jgi:hypothetical protein
MCRAIAFLCVLVMSVRASAQMGGAITGVVRDADARPIAGADVSVRPGDHKTRTDSTGRFTVAGLGADHYTVRARKLGYRPESWDVKLSKDGRSDIKLDLTAVPALLDTLKISAESGCKPVGTIEAFLCRRQRPGGLYLDYTDIDDKEKDYVGELFYDIPGFFVQFRITPTGTVYSVRTLRPTGCIVSLVDGRPMSPANPIPDWASRLIALEVYARPDSVPPELQRYTWPQRGDVAKSGRCAVIVYWTNRLPLEVRRGGG